LPYLAIEIPIYTHSHKFFNKTLSSILYTILAFAIEGLRSQKSGCDLFSYNMDLGVRFSIESKIPEFLMKRKI